MTSESLVSTRKLSAKDRKIVDEFVKTMNDIVIPEIVRTVHRRQEMAAKNRHRIIRRKEEFEDDDAPRCLAEDTFE